MSLWRTTAHVARPANADRVRYWRTQGNHVRRKIGLVIVILAGSLIPTNATGATAPSLGASSSPEGTVQTPELVPTHNYNLCGAACDAADAEVARSIAAFFFVLDDAISLSLQEICHDQWQQLFDDIADSTTEGLTGVFVASKFEDDDCADEGGDQRFGNAVIAAGSGLDYDGYLLSNPDRSEEECEEAEDEEDYTGLRTCPSLDCWNLENPTVECRTTVCNNTFVPYGPVLHEVATCSSHFTNSSDVVAYVQADDYLYISAVHASGIEDRWISGDFNLEPGQVPPGYGPPWLNLVGGPTIPAEDPTAQIDYIFTLTQGSGIRTPICDDDLPQHASDHCYTTGWVGFAED